MPRHSAYTSQEPKWQAAKAAQEAYAEEVEELGEFRVYRYEQREEMAEMVLAESRKACPERELPAGIVSDATHSDFAQEVLDMLDTHTY